MTSLPTSLYRADQVRALDRFAIEQQNIPGSVLMERAGKEATDILKQNWPAAGNICVVCGSGNNAGDGYVLARLCLESGLDARVFYVTDPASLKGDAQSAFEKFRAKSDAGPEKFSAGLISNADVIVDALLGTGIDREVTGEYRAAIEAINSAEKPVMAIDIPSGLNADTGNVLGIAVRSDITVTFIGLKQGMFTGQGREYCGRICFSDLEVPSQIYRQQQVDVSRIDYDNQSHLLTRREQHSHKGNYGHALIIGGDYGFAGAARMAAEAAARSGAGLVSLATRVEHAAGIPLAVPEIMARGIHKTSDLNPLLDKASVIAIGPGLGQSDWSSSLLARVLETRLPMVLDADALNLIARESAYSENWVLTPHVGEAARLLQGSTAEIMADRFHALRSLREKYGGVIILKGSGTLVAGPGHSISLCSDGNPGMASGGMGDVLTGIVAGLVAQGIDMETAAKLAVCIHAAAADNAAKQGERGLLATDLMPWVRRLVNYPNP